MRRLPSILFALAAVVILIGLFAFFAVLLRFF